MKTVHVAAAVIRQGDTLFATQRGHGSGRGRWEFPGGKTEPGETTEEALKREIREELETVIEPEERIAVIECDYPDFHLSMDCWFCRIVSGSPKLTEHSSARWLRLSELDEPDWLPADRILIEKIREMESGIQGQAKRRGNPGNPGTEGAGV